MPRNARRLLETTDLPVDRLAGEAGFGTAASMRRHLSGVLGVSPTAYRPTFRTSAGTNRWTGGRGMPQGRGMAVEFQVTFDSADPRAQAGFWAQALRYVPQPPPVGFDSWEEVHDARGVPADRRNDAAAIIDPQGVGPRVLFQKVPESKAVKNRVHLDLRAAAGAPPEGRAEALENECARLVTLGARRLYRLEADGVNGVCIVMHDPEGNEFCLD